MTTHSTNAAPSTPAPEVAYQKDGAAYLDKLRRVFGAYKGRAMKLKDIRPGLRILDVGCGTGEDAFAMAQLAQPGGSVVGVDSNSKMIEEARKRTPPGGLPVKFFEGDALKLPFDAGSFDRCCADRVFQHLRDTPAALAEMVRVAAAGGSVIVMDADWETLVIDSGHRELTRRILNFWCDQQTSGWVGRQLFGLFRQAGLSAVEVITDSIHVTEWRVADFMWGLDVFSARAAQAGIVTESERTAWLTDLKERDQRGAFFAAATGFGVRGTKG